MRGPEGGFYSALDADSGGIEGRFYVWTVAELQGRPRRATRRLRSPGSESASRGTSKIRTIPNPG